VESAQAAREIQSPPCCATGSGVALTRWAPSYDLVCMRYNEVTERFHFWAWNSERTDPGRVAFHKAYKPVEIYS